MRSCHRWALTVLKRDKSWFWRPEEKYPIPSFPNQAVRPGPTLFSSVRQVSILLLHRVFRWHNSLLQLLVICLWGWVRSRGEHGTDQEQVPLAPRCTGVTLLPFWKKQPTHSQEKCSIFKMTRYILVRELTACKAEDTLLLFYAFYTATTTPYPGVPGTHSHLLPSERSVMLSLSPRTCCPWCKIPISLKNNN